jgi:hypothetical protein
VNAIANEVIVNTLQSDYTVSVTAAMVSDAVQTIILNRPAHIDSLLERLKEERVSRIIEPMILGEVGQIDRISDDFLYVKDLGLIRHDRGKIEPANPIYAEVIVRTLSWNMQEELREGNNPYHMPRYLKNGKMDMDYLLRDFQEFWRENGAIWKARYKYTEAAPHLILMAFLQRVVNGGGHLVREMAAETRRLDLCVVYKGGKYPIELKILRGPRTEREGLTQTAAYMDVLGCREGWLVIFDRDQSKLWEDKIYMRKETVEGKTITVVGC